MVGVHEALMTIGDNKIHGRYVEGGTEYPSPPVTHIFEVKK